MIFTLENGGLDQKKKKKSDFDIFSIVNCEETLWLEEHVYRLLVVLRFIGIIY